MPEYISLTEAADLLGVYRNPMWLLVKAGELEVYTDPLDKRKKLIRQAAVWKLKQPSKA